MTGSFTIGLRPKNVFILPPFKRLRNRNHHFRSFGRQNRKLYPEALTYFKTYPNSRINKTKKEGMLGASS